MDGTEEVVKSLLEATIKKLKYSGNQPKYIIFSSYLTNSILFNFFLMKRTTMFTHIAIGVFAFYVILHSHVPRSIHTAFTA